MNYTIDTHNIKSPFTFGINISQCGLLKSHGKYISIPRIYDNYILTFIIDGQGTYTINNVAHTVKTGQAMLTTPNTLTYWTTEDFNPWQYIFIMLNGNECKNFLRKIGLGIKSKIFDFTLDNKIKQNLFNLYVTSKSSENTYYLCMGYFYMIADHIAKCLPCSQSHLCAPKNYYFENAKVYIDNNYSCNITINDIAKYLNIERSYLYKIFVSESGLSPIHFLTDYRLSKAVEMMEFSQLTITTIANSVGFYDISHFSRQFQKKYGITPGKYRKHIHDSENIPG